MRGRVRGGSSYFSGEVTLGEKREGRGGPKIEKFRIKELKGRGIERPKRNRKEKKRGKNRKQQRKKRLRFEVLL